jgi:paraquat-inducible protein B
MFVRAPHDQLVQADSRFWNASGFRASIGADGVRVETQSVQSLLAGGVAFDTPRSAGHGEPSPEHTVSPYIEAGMFPEEGHEDEELHRIGPF